MKAHRRALLFCRPFILPFLLSFALLALFLPDSTTAQTTGTATYRVTFRGNWTTASAGGPVVGGAHFTTLIGAVHNSNVSFWAVGQKASPGVEYVAELGGVSIFRSEVSAAGSGATVVQKSIGGSPTDSATFNVNMSQTHSRFTLLSMIGPSPDWFVGVSGLDMRPGGTWRNTHSVNLYPYDAGTEEGNGFSLSNPDTNPKENIKSIRGQGRFSGATQPMAYLEFTLISSTTPTPTATRTPVPPTATPIPPTSTPVPPTAVVQQPPSSNIGIAVSGGDGHFCALHRTAGSILCWGNNERGQASPPRSGTYTYIVSGETHTCALRSDGELVCWGSIIVNP